MQASRLQCIILIKLVDWAVLNKESSFLVTYVFNRITLKLQMIFNTLGC